MSGLGHLFQKIDWGEAGIIAAISFGYAVLAFIGFFIFPPLLMCLIVSDGNLNDCTFGIWGNGYSLDQSKFNSPNLVIETKPDETAANSSVTTYVVNTAAGSI